MGCLYAMYLGYVLYLYYQIKKKSFLPGVWKGLWVWFDMGILN